MNIGTRNALWRTYHPIGWMEKMECIIMRRGCCKSSCSLKAKLPCSESVSSFSRFSSTLDSLIYSFPEHKKNFKNFYFLFYKSREAKVLNLKMSESWKVLKRNPWINYTMSHRQWLIGHSVKRIISGYHISRGLPSSKSIKIDENDWRLQGEKLWNGFPGNLTSNSGNS